MAKPTTIRIPEDLLNEIDEFVAKMKLDRAAYLRDVMRKGFSQDRLERVFAKYAEGGYSLLEACEDLKCNPWDLFSMLRSSHKRLSVGLEDWLDSGNLDA